MAVTPEEVDLDLAGEAKAPVCAQVAIEEHVGTLADRSAKPPPARFVAEPADLRARRRRLHTAYTALHLTPVCVMLWASVIGVDYTSAQPSVSTGGKRTAGSLPGGSCYLVPERDSAALMECPKPRRSDCPFWVSDDFARLEFVPPPLDESSILELVCRPPMAPARHPTAALTQFPE